MRSHSFTPGAGLGQSLVSGKPPDGLASAKVRVYCLPGTRGGLQPSIRGRLTTQSSRTCFASRLISDVRRVASLGGCAVPGRSRSPASFPSPLSAFLGNRVPWPRCDGAPVAASADFGEVLVRSVPGLRLRVRSRLRIPGSGVGRRPVRRHFRQFSLGLGPGGQVEMSFATFPPNQSFKLTPDRLSR